MRYALGVECRISGVVEPCPWWPVRGIAGVMDFYASRNGGWSWDRLRSRVGRGIRGGEDPRPGSPEIRRAAVAAVVRGDERGGDELLVIRRAEHPLDPWSGHMAFPGGRVDPGDDGPLAAAVRETREEIALDLTGGAELLGELPSVPVIGRGKRLPMAIHPFVFALRASSIALELNYEVEEALWVPLDHLADRGRRGSFLWERAATRVHMPCVDYEGRRIWGLTLRMIDDLLG